MQSNLDKMSSVKCNAFRTIVEEQCATGAAHRKLYSLSEGVPDEKKAEDGVNWFQYMFGLLQWQPSISLTAYIWPDLVGWSECRR